MSTQIAVITHKEYQIPDDPLYVPVWAGSSLAVHVPDGYIRDDNGDNISEKNPFFCELTGLYWVWKNLTADNIGICHYRRYFSADSGGAGNCFGSASQKYTGKAFNGRMMTSIDAERIMRTSEIVLPAPRDYHFESNYSQYAHAHNHEDLDEARSVIACKHPAYIEFFDRRMEMPGGHRFNMFIMRRELLNEYCSWLFEILFELEKRLDISGYSERDRRVFGYVGERLLDVWIDAGGYRYKEVPYIMTEREYLLSKAVRMIGRRFTR